MAVQGGRVGVADIHIYDAGRQREDPSSMPVAAIVHVQDTVDCCHMARLA